MDITIIQTALDRARQRAVDWVPDEHCPIPDWRVAACAIIAIYDHVLREASKDGCFVRITDDFVLNKITHRLRFADETKSSVRVIVEPKGRTLTSAEWKMIVEDPDLSDQYHG